MTEHPPMPSLRIRLTVRRLMLGVALLALPMVWLGDRSQERRERCFDLADREAKIGAEYRRNSGGNAGMLRIAAWHEFQSKEYERIADEPWGSIPQCHPFPPKDWMPPDPKPIPNR
jgi:hypothetical protein